MRRLVHPLVRNASNTIRMGPCGNKSSLVIAPNFNRLFLEEPKTCQGKNSFSFSTFNYDSTSLNHHSNTEDPAPSGDLFGMSWRESFPSMLNKTASIRRTFTQQCNAQVMLISGGSILAAHASFDPEYTRARSYIYNHPVGNAVLSPVLISGLIGALVEAALPQSVFQSSTLRQVQPLIVGIEVEATIEVTKVSDLRSSGKIHQQDEKTLGYNVELKTQIVRFRDQTIIATGTHGVWFPGI